MAKTPLEHAYSVIDAGGEPARIGFFSAFLAAEVFLVLKAEAEGDQIEPEIFETEDGAFLLGFDSLDGLGGFSDAPLPYAGLSGRALVKMLVGQDIGLLLTLGAGDVVHAVTAEEIAWLADHLPDAAAEIDVSQVQLSPPVDLAQNVLEALDAKLTAAQGAARMAYLAKAQHGGGQAHLLAFIDADPAAKTALVELANEALAFSGVEAGILDVAFFDASDPMAAELATVGLGFELPQAPEPHIPSVPGGDPSKPPKLK